MKTSRWRNAHQPLLALLLALLSLQVCAQTGDDLDDLLERCQRIEHGTPEQARTLAAELLERIGQNDPVRRARALGCDGWAAAALGDMGRAEQTSTEIIALLPQLVGPADRLAALRRVSALRQRTGDINASIELLDQALVLAEASGLVDELATLYTSLGVAHSEAMNHSAAIGHYEKALALVEQGAPPSLRMPILYNLGLTLRGAGEHERAYEVFLELVEPLQQPGLEIRRASLYSVLGSIARERGNIEQARDWLQQSEALHRELDNPAEHTALLIDRSRLELEHGDPDLAARLAEAALAEARRADYYHSLRGALELNVDLLQRAGRDADALVLLREYVDLTERHMRDQNASELARVEARLGRETQARELAEARAESQTRSLALQQQQAWQRWALFGGILLLLVLLGAFAWQRASYRALHHVSRTDLLTGLHNRRGIRSLFENHVWSTSSSAGLLMLVDLDHFKRVNDHYGHDCGDTVLREVAQTLQQQSSSMGGHVGRWGGEEFLLLLPADHPDTAAAMAEALCAAIRMLLPRSRHGQTIPTTASIGFAPLSPIQRVSGQEAWEPAFLVADHMLYRAKRSGRNGWAGAWPTGKASIDPHRLDEQIEAGQVRALGSN